MNDRQKERSKVAGAIRERQNEGLDDRGEQGGRK